VEVNGTPLHIPIKAHPSRKPFDCVKLALHGLPAEFCRAGVTRAFLDSAGYTPAQVTIKEEFAGQHKMDFAARFPHIRRNSTVIAHVTFPDGDPQLLKLPRTLKDSESTITISVHADDTPVRAEQEQEPDPSTVQHQAGPPSAASEPMSLDHRPPSVRSMDVDMQDTPGSLAANMPGPMVPPPRSTDSAPAVGSIGDCLPSQARRATPPTRGTRRNPHRIDPLARPLDARADLGGQFGRWGMGYNPPPPPILPVPPARLVSRAERPLPTVQDPPGPSAPAVVQLPDDPIAEACMIWMEHYAPGISHEDHVAIVGKTHQTWPTLWAESRGNACVPPQLVDRLKKTWCGQLGGSNDVFMDNPFQTEEEILAMVHANTRPLRQASPSPPRQADPSSHRQASPSPPRQADPGPHRQANPSPPRQASPTRQPEWQMVTRRRTTQPPGFNQTSATQRTRQTRQTQHTRRNAPRQCRERGPHEYWRQGSSSQPADRAPPASAARRRAQP
jgi:hypothetical protein